MKIVKKGQDSRDFSPKFKGEVESAKNRNRAKFSRTLLEANARWNTTRRDTSANDIRRIVGETSTINPELRKELLYSWEYGFIEDKPEDLDPSTNLLRKDENRKSGKALTNPLKGKVVSETPHTVKTAAGAVYRKSDFAHAKIDTNDTRDKSPKTEHSRRSPHADEPRSKSKKKKGGSKKKTSDPDEMPELQQRSNLDITAAFYQISQQNVTSKELEVNGGLDLAVSRAKPNNAGPVSCTKESVESKGAGKKEKKPTGPESGKHKAATTAELSNNMTPPEQARNLNTSTPGKELKDKSKEVTRNTSAEKILETSQSRDLVTED